ncbi:MAG: VapE family protein, partial [Corynebacterium sp.]|nr:VapE family protein [Corynebacterium sp.]
AHRKAFYPLQDYILGLPMWDGIHRMDYVIPTVNEDEYTRAVFRNFFVSIIQRIFEPGCQVDSMMVLVGEQGCGKTSFFRSIFPCAPNEMGEIPVTSQHKDDLISCHETAITIIDEIDKIKKRSDQSNLKAFITRRVDRWRAPYARAECISPRSFVLCGTTNHLNFLQDSTGNRRYWPIKVEGRIPSYVLSRQWMDQCLAEAYQSYLEGDRARWDAEFEAMAKLRQEQHTDAPIADLVEEFLANPVRVMRDAPPPPGGGDQPVELVDTSRVSARLFIDSIEELADVDIKRDRGIVAEIEDVLDAHPDYMRMEGQQRYYVDGRSVRVAWKKIK